MIKGKPVFFKYSDEFDLDAYCRLSKEDKAATLVQLKKEGKGHIVYEITEMAALHAMRENEKNRINDKIREPRRCVIL